MFGTLVNAFTVGMCGIIGVSIRNGLKENYREIVMQVIPLIVMFVGISSALGGLLNPDANPVLFIISLVIGSIVGEWMKIEDRLMQFGLLLQNKFSKKESNLAQGFVTASILFCVGTMSILGSIESGVMGIHTILLAKSVIDGVTAVMLGSTMGIGVALSAISIFVYQGALTILARIIAPILTEQAVLEISIIGGIMIFALGVNMMELKKMRVGNMLPAIIVPIIIYLPFVQALIAQLASLFR